MDSSASAPAFGDSYEEARALFLGAAAQAGGAVTSYPHPLRGPAGETLALDVAVIGPADAPRILAAGCGTHGIEGFSGSAAMTHWLRSGGTEALAPGTGVVLFHAHNPWGFAHRTRTTEENVDLNRNFIDFGVAPPRNAGYEEVHPIVCLREWSEAALAEAFARLAAFRERVGEQAFSDALNGGQYAHPDGLFYGGARPQWANGAFHAAVAAHLGHAREVAFVDLHTGIGPRYAHVFIAFHAAGSPPWERARRWWGERAVNREGVTHKALARYQGLLIDALVRALPDVEVTPVVVEFGTLPREGMQRAGMLQRWLRFRAGDDPRRPELQKEYEEAFSPSEPRWREAVLAQGAEVLSRGLRGVAAG